MSGALCLVSEVQLSRLFGQTGGRHWRAALRHCHQNECRLVDVVAVWERGEHGGGDCWLLI